MEKYMRTTKGEGLNGVSSAQKKSEEFTWIKEGLITYNKEQEKKKDSQRTFNSNTIRNN